MAREREVRRGGCGLSLLASVDMLLRDGGGFDDVDEANGLYIRGIIELGLSCVRCEKGGSGLL